MCWEQNSSDPQGVGFCRAVGAQGLSFSDSPGSFPSWMECLGLSDVQSWWAELELHPRSLPATNSHQDFVSAFEAKPVTLPLDPSRPHCWPGANVGVLPLLQTWRRDTGTQRFERLVSSSCDMRKRSCGKNCQRDLPKSNLVAGGWVTPPLWETQVWLQVKGLLWGRHAQKSLSLTENCTAKVWFKIRDMTYPYNLLDCLVVGFFWVTQISSWLRFGKPSSCKCHPQEVGWVLSLGSLLLKITSWLHVVLLYIVYWWATYLKLFLWLWHIIWTNILSMAFLKYTIGCLMALRWSFFSTIWAKIIRVCPRPMSSDLSRIHIQFLIWTISDSVTGGKWSGNSLALQFKV